MTIEQIDQKHHCNGDANGVKGADENSNSEECDDGDGDVDVGRALVDLTAKHSKIHIYLEENDRISLKAVAVSPGGYASNELRLIVWPRLANIDHKSLPPLSEEATQKNEFYRQVILDVDRSLKRFPPSVHEEKRILYQDSLTKLIIRVLSHNPSLHYYQGYHDVCLTFLLMMDEESAFRLVNSLSRSHFKYFMEETMHTTSNHLQIIYLILDQEDRALHDYLVRSEVGTIFCLSWVITWFSHVLANFDDITRLFDYFVASHFLMPIYLTVSILLHKKENIHRIDCDMASMHQYLTSIPQKEQLPFDKLVTDSLALSVKYPPEDTLQQQKEIQESALKGAETKPSTFGETTARFLRQNVFSITFAVLVGAMIYQLYSEYSST